MHQFDLKAQKAAARSDEGDSASLSAGVALLSSKRVSVLAEGETTPLLPGKPILDSTHSPWTGLYLEEHRLGAVPIREHEHRTFVLHMQMNEKVEMEWRSGGGAGHQVTEAGNLIFLAPGTRDSLQFYCPSRRIVMSVDPLLIKQGADQLGFKGTPPFENRWKFKDEQLRLLITEMTREMGTGWAMGSLYGDSLSTAFVVALIKKCGKTPMPTVNVKGGLSPASLRQVLSYINEYFGQDIRLRQLAQVAGLSEYHFARSFRQSTGATPHQYLLQIRIDRAKSLLLQPEWSILQISGAIGFRDPSRFAKVFREMVGVGPAEWRRNS
jgi:AraC family transcriptional regulator